MSTAENFVLRTTPTSPFGRKVRMAIEALGLGGRITVVPADPLDETDTLRQQNPLGKMPCLVLGDGTTIYDSGIIIEYLQDVAGTDRLLPLRGRDRYRALTLSRTASWMPLFWSSTRPVFVPTCLTRRAGSRISVTRSGAGWQHSRHRRQTRIGPMLFRSA
jgi:glutathione S-transferase